MIASTRARNVATEDRAPDHRSRVCPACRSALGAASGSLSCGGCGRAFPTIAGIPDMRLAPDRYLAIGAERAKAARLAAIARDTDLAGLASAYYAMTEDVDARRRRRYLAHIRAAEVRGEALAALLRNDDRVLEIGCGTGGLLLAARRRGIDVEGVDVASRWLVVARKRLDEGSRRSLVGGRNPDDFLTAANAEALPWPDACFSCVVADSVLEHLDDPFAALTEWRRVLRPGGRLILWSPNRFSLARDPHVGLWGLGWLPRRFQASYVRARRGCGWPVQLRSAREVAHRLRRSGWTVCLMEPAPGSSSANVFVPLYDRGRHLPLVGPALLAFGPLWQIVAEREDSA